MFSEGSIVKRQLHADFGKMEASNRGDYTESDAPDEGLEIRSVASLSSSNKSRHSSVTSSGSLAQAKVRAKAGAAKARASYLKRELDLRIEKTKLEAKLEAMQIQKEVDAAQAEVEVMEAAATQLGLPNTYFKETEFPQQPESPQQRTSEYVAQQAKVAFSRNTEEIDAMCLTDQPSKGPHLSSQGQDGVSPVDHVQSGQRAKQRASSPLYDARPSYSGTKQRSSSPLCDTRPVHRGGKPCSTPPLHNVRLSFSVDRQRSYSPRRNARSSYGTDEQCSSPLVNARPFY